MQLSDFPGASHIDYETGYIVYENKAPARSNLMIDRFPEYCVNMIIEHEATHIIHDTDRGLFKFRKYTPEEVKAAKEKTKDWEVVY